MTTLPPQQCVRGFAGPSRDRIRPDSLFTDLSSFACPFTDSPIGVSPRCTSPASSSRMAFPKLPIPQSTSSTDSELFSDCDVRCHSPSLISSIFSRNPSSSCSASSHAAPHTPSGSNKPILRRPDCASASTSASEDCGRALHAADGLGLASMTSSTGIGMLSRKRSTLTFAVKCNVTSDSGHSPLSSFTRPGRNYSKSPARHLPAWHDVDDEDEEDDGSDDEEDGYEYCSPLIDDESESDDEGYQEDEEGGFTDDEDLIGTFTGLPAKAWAASARWNAQHPPTLQIRRHETSSTLVSDDGSCVFQPRGRKVSIATSKPDRCSRHISPPPSRASSPPPACPPAARSPSAIGLCRRRESHQVGAARYVADSDARGRGWRSDDSAFGRLPIGQKAKLSCLAPPPSILRPAPSEAAQSCNAPKPSVKIARRGSAPACSPIIIHRRETESFRDGAKRGLEAFLRRGSEK